MSASTEVECIVSVSTKGMECPFVFLRRDVVSCAFLHIGGGVQLSVSTEVECSVSVSTEVIESLVSVSTKVTGVLCLSPQRSWSVLCLSPQRSWSVLCLPPQTLRWSVGLYLKEDEVRSANAVSHQL